MTIWTRAYFIALLERVAVTFVVTLAGVFTADGFDFQHAHWKQILLAAGVATFLSLAKGIIANAATKSGPSLTSSEQTVPPEPQPVDGPVG